MQTDQKDNNKTGGDPASDEYFIVKAPWLTRVVRKLFGLPEIEPVRWRKTKCTACGGEIRTCSAGSMQGPVTHVLCGVFGKQQAARDRAAAANNDPREEPKQLPVAVETVMLLDALAAAGVQGTTLAAVRRRCGRLEADLNQANKHNELLQSQLSRIRRASAPMQAEALELACWLLKHDTTAPGRSAKLRRFHELTEVTPEEELLELLATGMRQKGPQFLDAFAAGWNSNRALPAEPPSEGPEYATCRLGWNTRQRMLGAKS